MEVWQTIVAAGIPSALCAFLFWMIERKISKTDKARERQSVRKLKKLHQKERQEMKNS